MTKPEATVTRKISETILERNLERNQTYLSDSRECNYPSFTFYNCVLFGQKKKKSKQYILF